MTISQQMDQKGNIDGRGKIAIIEGLALLQEAIRRNNFEKGWRTEGGEGEKKFSQRPVSEHTMLLTTEVAEIFEAYRTGEPELWYQHNVKTNGVPRVSGPNDGFADQAFLSTDNGDVLGKPQGMVSELADVIIRALDFADEYGFELIETILEKHDYNLTRPYRHGNKLA